MSDRKSHGSGRKSGAHGLIDLEIFYLLKFLSRQHLIALNIFIDLLLNHITRECPVVVRVCLQPVAGELLVKGRLSVSRLVSVCRPEA